jgi:hypothetical protein
MRTGDHCINHLESFQNFGPASRAEGAPQFRNCSLATFVLHMQSFISILCLFSLLPIHLYLASSKFNLFVSFALFAPYTLPFCFHKASILYFLCSFCSLPTTILNTQSFISLLCLFLYSLPTFVLHPRSFNSQIPLLFLFHAYLHFVPSKLHFFALFAPFAPCPPPFCIRVVLFFCFVCSSPTSILHP